MPTYQGASPFAGTFVKPAHGRQAQLGQTFVVELPPAGALPVPVPAPTSPPEAPLPIVKRRDKGRLADPAAAAELGRRGGLAKAAKAKQLKAVEGLGLRGTCPTKLEPFISDAEAWAKSEVERLAREVGAGHCSPAVASLVQSSALALAGSRAAYAAGELQLGAKLASDSQRGVLAAHSLAVLEARARAESHKPEDAVERIRRELAEEAQERALIAAPTTVES